MNKIKSNVFWSLVNNLSISALTFFQYKYFFQVVGAHYIGVWSVVVAGVSFAKVAEAGMGSGLSKFMFRFDKRDKGKLIGTLLVWHVLFTGVVSSVVFVVTPFFVKKVVGVNDIELAFTLIKFAVPCFFINSVAGFFVSFLDAHQKFKIKANLYIASQLFYILIAAFLAGNFGVLGLAWAQLCQAIFLLCACAFLIKFFVDDGFFGGMKFCLNVSKVIISHAVNSQISSIGVVIFEPLIKIFIGKFGEMSFVAYYDVANQILQKIRSMILTSVQSLAPVFSEINANNSDEASSLLRKATNKVAIVSSISFSACMIVSPFLIKLIVPDDGGIVFLIMKIIIPVSFFSASFSPFYIFNMSIGDMSKNTVSHVMCGLIFAGLSFLFGSQLGASGVLVLSTVVYCLTSIFYILPPIKSNKIKFINFSWVILFLFVWCCFFISGSFEP